MKNNKLWSLLIFALVLTFTSCTEDEEVDQGSDCPVLAFTQEGKILSTDFEGLNNLETYEWLINDELVETENSQNQRDDKLDLSTYNPGTYNVCVKANTPDCPNGLEFCAEVIIEEENNDSCPDLKYTKEDAYLVADFEGIDTLEFYAWEVTGEPLGNEVIVENEGIDNQGDNKFSLENLEPGRYTICLISESATCTSTEYCEEIVIENDIDDCPQLSFFSEGPIAEANFSGINNIAVYEWFVDGQLVETEDLQSQDRDDKLDLSSYNPGTYNVCLKYQSSECPQGVEFCSEITISEPDPIDCSTFDLIFRTGANFEFMDARTITLDMDKSTVFWSIDGIDVPQTITTQIQILALKNFITQPGTYQICYRGVSNICGELEKCIDIDYQGL